MSNPTEQPQDAITDDEIRGIAEPTQRNAFSELMSRKPRRSPSPSPSKNSRPVISSLQLNHYFGRGALRAYTDSPESYPPPRVLSYDADFVIINDLFPKSSLHMLLLPRDQSKQTLHPFDAFEDSTFLVKVKKETAKLRQVAASELRRRYGRHSVSEKERNDALDADDPPEVLPPGRDWDKEVISGVHGHPSMSHLHVHVLSVDRVSECMKHRKHYNSFATAFLIPIEDFPLARDDVRRHPGREGYLEQDLKCWQCGRNFGNKFARLKEHLEDEFEKWKAA